MSRIFRIDFYPQDFLIDTAKLDNESRGIYIIILCLIYSNRGPIQNDIKWISSLCGCSKTVAKRLIENLVNSEFLYENLGNIGQKRAEIEINSKLNHLKNSSKGGKNSGGQYIDNKDLVESDHKKSLRSPSPSPSPLLYKKEEIDKSISVDLDEIPNRRLPDKKPKDYTPEFLEFWEAYPKNNGQKFKAFEKYLTAIKNGVEHEIIIAGAFRYADYRKGEDVKYNQHAATWLYGKGWESEYTKPINSAPPTKKERLYAAARRAHSNFEERQQGEERVDYNFGAMLSNT